MNKIPIRTSTPISSWDRTTSEVLLMAETLNRKNISEVDEYLKVMRDAARKHEAQDINLENFLVAAQNYFYAKNYKEARSNIYFISIKAPAKSGIMKKALKLRGDIFMSEGNYERAVDDFELCMSIYEENLFSCELLGCLIEGYIGLGYQNEARYYLNIFENLYERHKKILNINGCVPSTVFHSHIGPKQVKIEFCEKMVTILAGLKKALRDIPVRRNKKYFEYNHNFKPFDGYTTNWKIMHASVACTLIETPKSSKMLANRFIPKWNIVAFERSVAFQAYSPNLQCDVCLQESDMYLPCLDCKIKLYCSMHCRKIDIIHKYECTGNRITLLPVLDAQLLYKTFLKCMFYIQANIFNQDVFSDIYMVHDLFHTVLDLFENSKPSLLRSLVAVTPNYKKFDQSEYATMVTVACKLTIFITGETTIMSDFFNNLKTAYEDNQLFIAALLLRLGANIAENTIELSYKLSSDKNMYFTSEYIGKLDYKRYEPGQDNISDKLDLDVYVKFDEKEARSIADKLIDVIIDDDKKSKNTIDLPRDYKRLPHNPKTIREYVYEITENIEFDASCNSISERMGFVYSTADEMRSGLPFSSLYAGYNTAKQTIAGIYPTLKKFNHSCDPNVEIIYLASGAIVAKTLCDIKYGDELTISFGTHYKGAPTDLRQQFLKHYNIKCECKICLSQNEPFLAHNSGYCYSCSELIHSNTGYCTGCGANRASLIVRYGGLSEIAASFLDPQILKCSNHVWQFQYNMVLFFMIEKFFPTGSFIIYTQKLKIAYLLAENNFIYEAYDALASIEQEPLKFCSTMSLSLFRSYYEILNVLMYILHYNIPSNKKFIQRHCKMMFKIFKMAWRIANFMLDINDFHIMFNGMTFNLLTIIQQLMAMRMACYTLLALDGVDKEKLIADYKKHMDIDDYDVMPDLKPI